MTMIQGATSQDGAAATPKLLLNNDGGLTGGYRCQATKTRPANQTAYGAGSVVGDTTNAIWTFAGVGPMGGNVMVTSIDLRIDINAIPSGMTSFRLYVYNASPASALANTAAFDLPSGDRSAFLGYIDIGSPADLGSTLYCQLDQVNKQFKLASTDINLYGYLVTNGGFTPAANSEVYNITIRTVAV